MVNQRSRLINPFDDFVGSFHPQFQRKTKKIDQEVQDVEMDDQLDQPAKYSSPVNRNSLELQDQQYLQCSQKCDSIFRICQQSGGLATR